MKKPQSWTRFEARHAGVASAYDALREACRTAGPLDERSVALAKLAVSVGGHIGRSVHMHAKKALRAGIAPEALRQVAILALPTIGLPRALEALHWIDESIEEMQSQPPTERQSHASIQDRRSRSGRAVRKTRTAVLRSTLR
jgi:alkylhydroperoxidase/carboxymuconolactone decarboxylase family protein YurZ